MGPEFHAGLCHLSSKWLQQPLFCSSSYLQIQTRVWHKNTRFPETQCPSLQKVTKEKHI